jgi:phosphopantetheinyl transferase (holo-ACP synthase)
LKKNWQALIGNDLVDLRQAAADSNWQRKGYLSKICTPREQQMILDASVPAVMLWLIWTMKEASYKIQNRMTGVRNYQPAGLSCSNLKLKGNTATGQVTCGQDLFLTRSEISDQLVHSTAVLRMEDFEDLRLHYLDYAKSYTETFNLSSANYRLSSTPSGLPEMTSTLTGKSHAVSVSHHGRYLAVIYSGSLLLTD